MVYNLLDSAVKVSTTIVLLSDSCCNYYCCRRVAMRLFLVYRYKERITQTPAIPPLDREKLLEKEKNVGDGLQRPQEAFSLKRSGKVVRTVRSSASQARTWTPPATASTVESEDIGNQNTIEMYKKSLLIAEVYIRIHDE